jgi:hypothetical protein
MRAVGSKGRLEISACLRPRVCALVIGLGLNWPALPTANAQQTSSDLLSGQRLIFENDDVWVYGSNQQPPAATMLVTIGKTSGSAITGVVGPSFCGNTDQLPSVFLPTAAKGRMFNQAADSVAVVNIQYNQLFVCVAQGNNPAVPTFGPISPPAVGSIGGVAMAPFGGSYAQLFIKWSAPSNDYLAIVYPADPNNQGAGLRITPWVQAGPSFPGVAVGNFNGNTNGTLQVARGKSDASNNLSVYYDTVDPKTLAITPGAATATGFNTGPRALGSGFSMAAGHFLCNPASAQLVITYYKQISDPLPTGQAQATVG